MIVACQVMDPGSIPGDCMVFFISPTNADTLFPQPKQKPFLVSRLVRGGTEGFRSIVSNFSGHK